MSLTSYQAAPPRAPSDALYHKGDGPAAQVLILRRPERE